MSNAGLEQLATGFSSQHEFNIVIKINVGVVNFIRFFYNPGWYRSCLDLYLIVYPDLLISLLFLEYSYLLYC